MSVCLHGDWICMCALMLFLPQVQEAPLGLLVQENCGTASIICPGVMTVICNHGNRSNDTLDYPKEEIQSCSTRISCAIVINVICVYVSECVCLIINCKIQILANTLYRVCCDTLKPS